MSTREEGLSFITDKSLQKTIKDAVQYMYLIFETARKSKSALFKEETYRVIVLYSISIIESILVFIYNKRDVKMTYTEYKYVKQLSKNIIHKDNPNSDVVTAVKKILEKPNSMIRLVDLVRFFVSSGLMKDSFGKEILNLNDVRNTFHFTKPRNKITCEVETVEHAFNLLLRVIEKSPNAIKHKVS